MTDYGAPIFIVKETRRHPQTVWFECPVCGKHHTHGRPITYNPEHRASHCRDKDAFPDGYYIQMED